MTPRERLHGYDLDADERRLLRSPPPRRAIAWCEAVTGARVTRVRALAGGCRPLEEEFLARALARL